MNIESGKEYAFSLNNEDFNIDKDSILDNFYIGNHKIVYVGEQQKKTHKDFINVDSLIEKMQEDANFESEYADGYLEDFTKEHEENLEKLILEYMDKNLAQPNFYEVINIQEISIAEFEKLFC